MESSSSRDEATTENTCRFFQLPFPLILDILSRLPIKDILHCRCVCKGLFCFVYDHQFASLHLSRSPFCILAQSFVFENFSTRLRLSHIDADGKKFRVSKLNFTEPNVPTCHITNIIACNGVLCFSGGKKDDPFYVCNPILGEFITIQPPYKDMPRGKFWGLGYSTVTHQYKLLQSYIPIVESQSYDSIVESTVLAEIYTIGTGTWRSIGNAPTSYFVALPFNAFLNGALHWSNDSRNAVEFIHSFDFDVEQFGNVPPPDHFRKEDDYKFLGYPMIGVLGGCLFIIHIRNEMRFDIWVMKEYGVKESWTKQFVIDKLYPMEGIRVDVFYQPMVVLSNGKILMSIDMMIVCYNQERKQLRQTKFFGTYHSLLNWIRTIAYTPCFVSLYNVAKGERITRMQSTRGYDKICTQEFQDCIGCGARLANSS